MYVLLAPVYVDSADYPPSALSKSKETTKPNRKTAALNTTIIVKSVGKVAFFASFFFLLSPVPGPVLRKTLMFVRVIVLLYRNIEQGGRGYLPKKNSLF